LGLGAGVHLERRLAVHTKFDMLTRRTEICRAEEIGLTKLYNSVGEGALAEILDLHKELDQAVADCYDWPVSISQNAMEMVRRLIAFNVEITKGTLDYDPFAAL